MKNDQFARIESYVRRLISDGNLFFGCGPCDARRMKLDSRPSDVEYQAVAMFAAGMTDREIADELGKSIQSVTQARYRARVRARTSKVAAAMLNVLQPSN